MEDGRAKVIIDKLTDMIENGQNVTFSSGKVAVNKDEALMLIKELQSVVDGELKIYREVNDRKGRIITEAKKEAEDIIYEAEQTASRIRVTKRMSNIGTGFRSEYLDDEEKLALRTAHDIYAASVIYTDEMLTEVTDVVAEAYDIISNQYGRMVSVLEEKAQMIAENKAELMSGLRELSKEERYSQIMELSQLLANELYNEKHRQGEIAGYDANYDSAFGDEVTYYDEYEEYYNNQGAGLEENTVVSTGAQTAVEDESQQAGTPAVAEDESQQAGAKTAVEDESQQAGNQTATEDVFDEVQASAGAKIDIEAIKANIKSARAVGVHNVESDIVAQSVDEKKSESRQSAVGGEADRSLSAVGGEADRSVSAVEEKILEKSRKREVIDKDGVELLHPVNQYENKKDPVANTLNMFKRAKKDGGEHGTL